MGVSRQSSAEQTNAERLEVLIGLEIPVATGHLIAMKLLDRDDRLRPTDAEVLRALATIAREPDWVEARLAVELINRRGYGRGRDLGAALAQLSARAPGLKVRDEIVSGDSFGGRRGWHMVFR